MRSDDTYLLTSEPRQLRMKNIHTIANSIPARGMNQSPHMRRANPSFWLQYITLLMTSREAAGVGDKDMAYQARRSGNANMIHVLDPYKYLVHL